MGLYLTIATMTGWLQGAYYIALALLGLNLVILVHELGHFIVARLCGVKCEKFYVWFDIFGLRIFRFRWGETEYGLGILPLGGYVKMLGQEDNPVRLREEIERAKLAGADLSEEQRQALEAAENVLYDPRSYLAKPVYQRMAIISAGVIANVLFAFIAGVVAYGIGVEQVDCAVGSVYAGEAAWQAGLKPGDHIERIAGKPVRRFSDLQKAISVGDIDNGVPIVVRRVELDGTERRLNLLVFPDRIREIPTIGISNGFALTLADPPAMPGTVAAKTRPRLQAGDKIIAINGRQVHDYAQLHALLYRFRDEPITVTIVRSKPGQKPQQIEVVVPPQPARGLGLVMKMGPIVAVRRGSPAEQAGIQPGDLLVAVDSRTEFDPMALPYEFFKMSQQKENVTLTIRRGKQDLQVVVRLEQADWTADALARISPVAITEIGIAYQVVPEVVSVRPGTPAAKQDLPVGKRIVEATLLPPSAEQLSQDALGYDPQEIPLRLREVTVSLDDPRASWFAVFQLMQETLPGTQVELKFDDGQQVRLPVVELSELMAVDRGFELEPLSHMERAENVWQAIRLGAAETWGSLTLIFRTLQKLGTGQVSPRGLAGPVGIMHIAYGYASRGLASLLVFLCLLSANLAVLNFIPIPVLDGGHILFLSYEAIRGKPPSERVLTGLTFIGLLFLLSLMLWVTGMDLLRLFSW